MAQCWKKIAFLSIESSKLWRTHPGRAPRFCHSPPLSTIDFPRARLAQCVGRVRPGSGCRWRSRSSGLSGSRVRTGTQSTGEAYLEYR